jgi:hypothetical protein
MFNPRDWRRSNVGKIKWKHGHLIDATNKVDANIQFQVGDVVTSLLKTSLWFLVEWRMCTHINDASCTKKVQILKLVLPKIMYGVAKHFFYKVVISRL